MRTKEFLDLNWKIKILFRDFSSINSLQRVIFNGNISKKCKTRIISITPLHYFHKIFSTIMCWECPMMLCVNYIRLIYFRYYTQISSRYSLLCLIFLSSRKNQWNLLYSIKSFQRLRWTLFGSLCNCIRISHRIKISLQIHKT